MNSAEDILKDNVKDSIVTVKLNDGTRDSVPSGLNQQSRYEDATERESSEGDSDSEDGEQEDALLARINNVTHGQCSPDGVRDVLSSLDKGVKVTSTILGQESPRRITT